MAQDMENNGLYETLPFKSNEIPIGIGTTKALAKIDTGADLNLISKKFFDTLRIQYKNKLKAQNFIVLCVNNSSAEMLGTVTLPISISGRKISQNCTMGHIVMCIWECHFFNEIPQF